MEKLINIFSGASSVLEILPSHNQTPEEMFVVSDDDLNSGQQQDMDNIAGDFSCAIKEVDAAKE